jgi:hypothetical protein
VLKVVDQTNQREAALRVLSPTFGAETIDRFLDHMDRVIELDFAHIARVYDYDRGLDSDHTFVVEELVEGSTLFERMLDDSQSLSVEEAFDLALDLTLALEHAHSRGVIHGNLKLRDIVLTETGVKINGFALGRLEEGRDLLEAPMLFSTASHLAPEQILGYPLDARSDLYALGVILYQLFAGQTPFKGSDHEVMQAHLELAPTPPRELNSNLSRSIEHLILKLLAKNPNERYVSAQQVHQVASSLVSGADEAGQPVRKPLVGRDTEFQTLQGCWAEVNRGRGQLIFISGEPGVGKTSLAQQMAIQADAPLVLTGHCQEQAGGPAFHLIGEVLRAYFSTVPPEISDPEAQRQISHFGHLVPELSLILPDLPEPAELEPQQAQWRLIASLTQFIQRATQARPWLWILDDLQWVDESSVEFLRYVGRHLPVMSLLIVGTYREVDIGSDHPLQAQLRDLGQSPIYHHMPLDRLNEADVAQVLRELWDPSVPESLAATIYRHTEGNPLYVEEVAQGLVDDGLVQMSGGRWHFPEIEAVRLPQSVHDALERRIHYLNAETRDVLSQAAVLGQTFRLDDVVATSGLTEWTVLDHLDLALERRLVQEVSGELLRFRHVEIHHVMYDDLGRLRRRRLHRRAGETIEQRSGLQPEERAGELAFHFGEAGELQ